jgi:phosphoribosylformylglycinamidine synthase II
VSKQLPPNPDPILNVEITPALIEKHGIRPEEYEHIQSILGRKPNLVELGIFSVMWSEHCAYKNSRPLLKLFPTSKQKPGANGEGRILVKAGEENAGVVDIGDGWAIAFKIESHNHPSAVEPFEGAATGVGGIIRDIFTMGARPVFLTNSLRFGKLSEPIVKRLFRGVVAGISHYGNCIGIPNIGGDLVFDPSYEGNPLVNAMCLGILRHDEIKRGAASGVGNPVYYVGAATGRDGLGGASFASRNLTEESQEDRPAVQKGDPFMEKLLMEACLEMMVIPGLVVGIQDMGAAGLTCSSCETASRGGAGIKIDLNKVPQRETGMNAYEIMLSESQERMLVIVQKGREKEIEDVFAKWDLHAANIGVVTDTGRMEVYQGDVLVADIPARGLTDEAPVYHRELSRGKNLDEAAAWSESSVSDLSADKVADVALQLISHPTLASKHWVYRQYDHMVQANTAVAPGSDAGVVRLQLDGKEKILAVTNDGNGRYCGLDPYKGGLITMAESLRNLACSGARPLGMTDNLNYGNPYNPEVFYTLDQSVRALSDACRFFDVPVVGGNVSLYNENPRGAIDPTPVVCVVGQINRAEEITTSYVPCEGAELYLLGGWPHEIGASLYLQEVHGLKTGKVPAIDLEKERALQEVLLDGIAQETICAAHDLSDGGLLTTLLEMLFGPDHQQKVFGAQLDLSGAGNVRLDALLFGESQGRAVVAVCPSKAQKLRELAAHHGVSAELLGKTVAGENLAIALPANRTVNLSVSKLRKGWYNAIDSAMQSGVNVAS